MTDEKPIPGTYGAIVRSTEPMPWRQMLKAVSFTQEELVRMTLPEFLAEHSRRVKAAMDMIK